MTMMQALIESVRGYDRPHAAMIVVAGIRAGKFNADEAVNGLGQLLDEHGYLFEPPPTSANVLQEDVSVRPRAYTRRIDRWEAMSDAARERGARMFTQRLPLNAARSDYLLTLFKIIGKNGCLTVLTSAVATTLNRHRDTIFNHAKALERAGLIYRKYDPRSRLTTYWFSEAALVVPSTDRQSGISILPIHRTAEALRHNEETIKKERSSPLRRVPPH